jgi:nitrite reductase/ring-hydroxylating ferredoxin subunit
MGTPVARNGFVFGDARATVARPTRLTTVDTVVSEGSWLCTVDDPRGDPEEVVLVPCDGGGEQEGEQDGDGPPVRAWVNTCTHESQRLDRGGDVGAVIRDGQLVCPKHGSLFDTCDGGCDNGPAAGSPLLAVEIAVNRGDVYLTDDDYDYRHDGGIDDGDDGPDSTSHLRF